MIRTFGSAAALACVLSPCVAPARFAPVEDRRYRYTIDETRTAGGVARRFHVTRSIVFHHTDTGFDAVVTLEAVSHSPADDAGAMFQAATGALLRRPLLFHLDAAGTVTGVDDAEAVVALVADAIERLGTGAGARPRGNARTLAAPVRAAASADKAAMIVSILAPVVLPGEAERAGGTRPVVLPNRPPLPAGARLAGTETVARTRSSVTITLSATGTTAEALPKDVAGATSPVRVPTMTLSSTRTIDPATGLLQDGVERTTIVLPGDGSVPRSATAETRTSLRIEAP